MYFIVDLFCMVGGVSVRGIQSISEQLQSGNKERLKNKIPLNRSLFRLSADKWSTNMWSYPPSSADSVLQTALSVLTPELLLLHISTPAVAE